MLSAKLLIPAVVLGVVALASAKPAGAKPGAAAQKPGATTTPPPDVMAKIAAAFQAADPGQIRKVADEVEAAGFKAQADDLRAFAKKIDAELAAAPVGKPPAQPTLPPAVPGASPIGSPATQAPILPGLQPLIPAAPSSAPIVLPEQTITSSGPTQAQRVLAGKTALMLRNASKGKEDKGLVTAFQQQELDLGHAPGGAFGNVSSKADGLYGPKSGLQLARHYAIVPPKPLYWSKTNWLTDKKNWRSEMARFAAIDPQRADEWSAAGNVL